MERYNLRVEILEVCILTVSLVKYSGRACCVHYNHCTVQGIVVFSFAIPIALMVGSWYARLHVYRASQRALASGPGDSITNLATESNYASATVPHTSSDSLNNNLGIMYIKVKYVYGCKSILHWISYSCFFQSILVFLIPLVFLKHFSITLPLLLWHNGSLHFGCITSCMVMHTHKLAVKLHISI